ncbi:hypothetical protein M501DRAFT_917682, partial [Patellaria atrata CBS 101060]
NIIFSGCHDNGYIPNPESYKHDSFTSSRITLLDTTPAEPRFRTLNFITTQFPSVFRYELLPDPPLLYPQAASFVAPVSVPSIQTPAKTVVSPPSTVNSAGSPKLKSASTVPHATKPPDSPQPSSSWATVGKSGISEKIISIAPIKPVARKYLVLNMYDERLDLALQKPDRTAMDSLRARVKKQKVCNDYHVLGKCDNDRYCTYSHAPKLTAGELLSLKQMARFRCCDKWSDCRDIDCYYGHTCPNDDCRYDDICYFRDLHSMD